jgi:hypothetical protein
MEDDAWLSAAVPGIIAALTEPADAGDWDMVKLTGNNTLRALSLRHIALGYQLGVPFTRLPGAAAYLINRAAAQCYLERMLPMTVLFDHAFDRGWALGLRTRAVVPLPASGVNTIHAKRSTIDRPGAPKEKVTLWQKGPTLWWRTENEVSRVMFALAALFRSMRYRHSRKPSVLHAEPVPLREPARGSHPW